MPPSRLEVKAEGGEHPDSMVLPLLVWLKRYNCSAFLMYLLFMRAERDWRSRDAHLNEKGGWRSWCTEQWRRDESCSVQKNLEGLINGKRAVSLESWCSSQMWKARRYGCQPYSSLEMVLLFCTQLVSSTYCVLPRCRSHWKLMFQKIFAQKKLMDTSLFRTLHSQIIVPQENWYAKGRSA